MNAKTENMNYLSIPLSSIGKVLTVTLCGQPPQKNGIHFESIATNWLEVFLNEVELFSPEDQKNRIKGIIQISKEDKIYRVQAKIEFEPMLECIRSLTKFRKNFTVEGNCFFDHLNTSISKSKSSSSDSDEADDEICLSSEDLDAYTYQGNFIHLDEFVLDLIQTSLPSQPLCAEHCRGLCPNCGMNLNQFLHCECQEKSKRNLEN